MKKNYVEPAMRAVKLQQRRMLCQSRGAKGMTTGSDLNWASEGTLGDGEEDY